MQRFAFSQPPQKQHTQPVARHDLPGAHRQGVEGVGGPEGGGGTGLLIGQHQSHQHHVGRHRRQRRQPLLLAPGGEQGGQQRGGGAHHDVQDTVGAEQVGDEASHAQTPRRLRHQEGQDAQRLGKTALDRAVGNAEYGAENAQYGVGCAHNGGAGQLTGMQLHEFVSSL